MALAKRRRRHPDPPPYQLAGFKVGDPPPPPPAPLHPPRLGSKSLEFGKREGRRKQKSVAMNDTSWRIRLAAAATTTGGDLEGLYI